MEDPIGTCDGDLEVVLSARAYRIFHEAFVQVSGLGRTVRGPSMSTMPGKIVIDGVTNLGGEKVFVLKFLQAREPEWVGQVFFARYDPKATWLHELVPALGKKEFFFEKGLRAMLGTRSTAESSPHRLPLLSTVDDAAAG